MGMACKVHGEGCTASLDAGRYFGGCARRVETPHALATEVFHATHRELPEHDHALAYFCMLVDGHYVEQSQGRSLEYSRYEVGFHPARTPHRDRVGNDGGRFLCVEIRPALFSGGDVRLKPELHSLPGSVSLQMLRLLRALRDESLGELELESAAWELCGEASEDRAISERSAPRWLARLLAILEESYAQPLTVAQLAHELDLHPVHVAREFRRRTHLTVGEYVNQVRVRAACRTMRGTRASLSEVAHATGFSDHAHFCRVFRRAMGCTPSAFSSSINS